MKPALFHVTEGVPVCNIWLLLQSSLLRYWCFGSLWLSSILKNAFISSNLDFCNVLLYGLPQSVIDRLQYVQNCAARLVTRTRSSEHITPVLRRLHWLPVRQRFRYKILRLSYKALNGMAPKYIADLLQPYTPTRQLRSSSKILLVTLKSNLKFYGGRSF